MAKTSTCDICGDPAISIVRLESTTTTPVVLDVCEKHLAEFKKLVHVFAGQETEEKDDNK